MHVVYIMHNYILLSIIYCGLYVKAFIKLISESAQRQVFFHSYTLEIYLHICSTMVSLRVESSFYIPKEREKIGKVVGILRKFVS